MADQEKKISFSATDSGISSFMKKLQSDSMKMYNIFAEEAKKQLKSAQDQNKFIQERLRLLKEELRAKQDIAKAELDRVKGNYDRSVRAVGPDNVSTQLWKDKYQQAQAEFDNIKEERKVAQQASSYREFNKEKSVFGGVVAANLLRDLAGLIKQMPSAQTGLDLVSPMSSIAGGAAGGLTGSVIDAANIKILGTGLGDTQFGPILAQLGKEAGGFFGDAITRSFKIRNEFDTAYLGFRGLTGSLASAPDLASMGFDDIRVAQMMTQAARASGTAKGAGKGATGALGLSRGFGIEEGVTLEALGLQRSGAGNGMTNVQRGLGIAIGEGIERTKLGDVIKGQSSLLQQFSSVSTVANVAQANRTMFEFNRMGGMFSIGDPRSLTNISNIQNDLSNPSTPFGQAANYAVLRRLSPGGGIFDLLRSQEQGLQTPGFLSGVMGQISGLGMSGDMQKLMLKSRLPSLSFDAIDTLFNNKDQLGSMSQGELNKMLGMGTIKDQGEDFTSRIMRNQAEVTNAFKDSFIEGIAVLKDQFINEMGLAAVEVARILKAEFGLGAGDHRQGGAQTHFDSKGRSISASDRTPMKNGGMSKFDKPRQISAVEKAELSSLLGAQ